MWDARLTFSCWMHNGLSIVPNYNLVKNIGFTPEGTSAKNERDLLANVNAEAILPLQHPEFIIVNKDADTYFYRQFCASLIPVLRLRQKFEELIPWKIRKKINPERKIRKR